MLNYHEMTMTEARDSPQRRKQFLIICSIIFGVLLNVIFVSGLLFPVEITEGVFPGGEFAYKFLIKDYAASMGTLLEIAKDLSIPDNEQEDLLYSVFIDDMSIINEGDGRFMAGLLTDETSPRSIKMHSTLREDMNPLIEARIKSVKKKKDLNALRFPENIVYENGSLPSVVAGVAHFPFTNGFVSALIFSYKVLPAMQKWAAEHIEDGSPIIIATTCSIDQQMCTHYAPLIKGDEFLLGRPNSKEYKRQMKKEEGLSISKIVKGLQKLKFF